MDTSDDGSQPASAPDNLATADKAFGAKEGGWGGLGEVWGGLSARRRRKFLRTLDEGGLRGGGQSDGSEQHILVGGRLMPVKTTRTRKAKHALSSNVRLRPPFTSSHALAVLPALVS